MNAKLIRSIGLATALAGSTIGALAKEQPGQAFITKAIQGNLAEAALGQLAQQKSASDGVRSFGQQLVTDHTAANQRATAVASQMGVTPPTEPDKKQKAMYDKMAKLTGDAFDRQFVKHMVDDHKKDVADYQKAAKRPNNPAAGYASETLPTLQQHLQTAQALAKSGTQSR
jgi:putative membrane protein